MDPIFLVPEATVSVSIKPTYSGDLLTGFAIESGGPYELRTATGREFGRVQKIFRDNDIDEAFDILPKFLVKGIEKRDIENLHPDLVWVILIEVLKRSRVSEAEAGK